MNIYLSEPNIEVLLWKWGENIGNIWNAIEISIPMAYITEDFSLIFEGVIGGKEGNIAIDDVFLRKGACGSFGSCTFEDYDYCTWTNVEDGRDNIDWVLQSGETDAENTGPT